MNRSILTRVDCLYHNFLNVWVTCPRCKGSGYDPLEGQCDRCGGIGEWDNGK